MTKNVRYNPEREAVPPAKRKRLPISIVEAALPIALALFGFYVGRRYLGY